MPRPKHGCMPDSTSPHESDDENCKSSDIDVQNNDAEANINQEVPKIHCHHYLRDLCTYTRKYQLSPAMAKFIKEVFPHMLSPNMTHTHPLDESMYGGTLTLGDKEVSL